MVWFICCYPIYEYVGILLSCNDYPIASSIVANCWNTISIVADRSLWTKKRLLQRSVETAFVLDECSSVHDDDLIAFRTD